MKTAERQTRSSRATRIPRREIQRIAAQIARAFEPEKIILFGSYAYGKPKPYSDVDLLVILRTDERPLAKQQEILRALSPHPFGMDILVQTPTVLNERIALGDSFLREITSKGMVLYERARS